MASKLLVAVAAAVLVDGAWASGNFLAAPKINPEDLEADLLAELAGSVGNASATAAAEHVNSLEAALRPMFAAVPKEQDGTLSHNVVRYVLQRFFAHRHGWFIRGLEPFKADGMVPGSTASNASLQAVQEWAPAYLQSFLEKLMAGRGVSLRELAVLTATLEDLVHKEEKSPLASGIRVTHATTKCQSRPKGSI